MIRPTVRERTGGRSARVVEAVMTTTLELLGEVGFDALRIDEVAQRSGVNKTTIYRRWPTRESLVHEALMTLTDHPLPDRTGDLEHDLIVHFEASLAWLMTPLGRGIARVITTTLPEGALKPIFTELRETMLGRRSAIIREAIADGRMPATTDARFIAELMSAGIFPRAVKLGEDPEPGHVARVVRIVLAGARAMAGIPTIGIPRD